LDGSVKICVIFVHPNYLKEARGPKMSKRFFSVIIIINFGCWPHFAPLYILQETVTAIKNLLTFYINIFIQFYLLISFEKFLSGLWQQICCIFYHFRDLRGQNVLLKELKINIGPYVNTSFFLK
jgi:hypothetical protein